MTTATTRLFWTDPTLLEFDAEVLRAAIRGDAWAVTLDRTAFFPAAGGQPSDRGTLMPLSRPPSTSSGQGFETASGLLRSAGKVIDVIEEGEELVHIVEGVETARGDSVRCTVDAARREDLACQHTAQHVVSAVAAQMFGARTVGFHLGERVTSVDLEGGDLDPAKIREIERAANRIAREDRAVRTAFASGGERRGGDRMVREEGELRVVSIDGLDENACCGSHVDRTGRIGAIRLGRLEKVRAAARVELYAGDRVLAQMDGICGIASALGAVTGAGIGDLQAWAEAKLAEIKDLKKRNDDLARLLADAEAAALIANAGSVGGHRVIASRLTDRDAKALRGIAAAARKNTCVVAIVGAACEGKAALIISRAEDVALDARPILKAAAEALDAKGGGTADLAQCGGGDPSRLDAAIALAADLVRAALERIRGR